MIEALRCRDVSRIATLVGFLVAASIAGCTPAEQEPAAEVDLEELDTVLAELGGRATADLTRGQRWRLISSVGAGLPPSNFSAEDLPDAGSHGAVLLETYCDRCHGLPAPQMHGAGEWPILLRRMQTRGETLHDRLGGPMTRELMGEYVLSGMATAAVPSEADLAVMLEYLQANALPVAEAGELWEGEEADLYRARCSACHETPSPAAHPASEWPAVVARMRANAALQDVRVLTDEDAERIVRFLESSSR